MKIPDISLKTWRPLYQELERFRLLEPWNFLSDSQLFCVKDLRVQKTGYGCVLGALGEMRALCLYRGGDGFSFHQNVVSGAETLDPEEAKALQNCLMAEFVPKDELEKQDLQIIKLLNITGKNEGFPRFRSFVPGYAPWFITENEAEFLLHSLRAGRLFSEKFLEGSKDLKPPKKEELWTYFISGSGEEITTKTGFSNPVTEVVEPIECYEISELEERRVSVKSEIREETWELDYFYPAMGSIMEGDRPYWPRMVLVVEQKSLFVVGTDIFRPDQNISEVLVKCVLKGLQTTAHIPKGIWVKNEETRQLLGSLTTTFGIEIINVGDLKAIAGIKGNLNTSLLSRSGQRKG